MEATIVTNKLNIGDRCGIIYNWKGRKCKEDSVYFDGIVNNKVLFKMNNWANDFIIIKLKDLIEIKTNQQ